MTNGNDRKGNDTTAMMTNNNKSVVKYIKIFDFGTQNMEMRDYAKNLLILVCCKLHKKLHQQ